MNLERDQRNLHPSQRELSVPPLQIEKYMGVDHAAFYARRSDEIQVTDFGWLCDPA